MTLYGAVCRLIFVYAVRGNQYTGHHSQATVGGGDHIAHHIAIVVFTRPDITAFRADHAGNGIVDQGIEILDPCCIEFFLIFSVKDLFENILEPVIVLLGNGIIRCKPEVLLVSKA